MTKKTKQPNAPEAPTPLAVPRRRGHPNNFVGKTTYTINGVDLSGDPIEYPVGVQLLIHDAADSFVDKAAEMQEAGWGPTMKLNEILSVAFTHAQVRRAMKEHQIGTLGLFLEIFDKKLASEAAQKEQEQREEKSARALVRSIYEAANVKPGDAHAAVKLIHTLCENFLHPSKG